MGKQLDKHQKSVVLAEESVAKAVEEIDIAVKSGDEINSAALAAMSRAVYKWNKEDIIAVEDALENGTLDGTNKGKGHSPEETKAMKDSGKFYRLYVVYIRKTVRPASVIRRKMVEWKAKYTDAVDPKIGLPLATPGFDDQFERCLGLVEHLVDVAGVDSNYAERPKPGSKHTLTRWRSSRGAKVETFHLASRHYANLGTNARATQALQMEGVCRDNADRREDAKQFVGEDGDESARALTRVAHYRPWVRRERNILAEKAGQPQPYPEDGKVRPADNGERFYYEYHLEQEKRDPARATSTCSPPCAQPHPSSSPNHGCLAVRT